MSIMTLLSIEKTRKECFVLVGGVNCFGVIVRSSSHITGCRLDFSIIKLLFNFLKINLKIQINFFMIFIQFWSEDWKETAIWSSKFVCLLENEKIGKII